MSLLGIMGSGHFYRMGCAGAINAAKILGANSGQTSSTLLVQSSSLHASSSGRIFTAIYLQQKKDAHHHHDHGLALVNSSKSLGNCRLMSSSGDHVKLWTAERIVSGCLVPLLPMALIMPCAPFDYLLAFGLTIHSHWGIEAIVHDYVRPSIFGEAIPKFSIALVYGLSAFTLGGLFYFIYADVGIGQAVRMLWKL